MVIAARQLMPETIGRSRRLDKYQSVMADVDNNPAKALGEVSVRAKRTTPCNPFGLTPRELGIVGRFAAGYTNERIAGDLKIGRETLKRYLAQVFEKLGSSNRLEVALLVVNHQLVDLTEVGSDSAPAEEARPG